MALTDILGIKIQNAQSILRAVRFEDGITKKSISEITGLSFATVSNLCNEFTARGVLLTAKDVGLSVGRTPQTLKVNYNHYFVLCINLQLLGTMELALTNFRNEVVDRRLYCYEPEISAEEIVRAAHGHYLSDLLPMLGADAEVIGVGVAVSAIYDIHTSRLISCAIERLENTDMKALVEREFGIRAYVDNEANLCACGIQALESNCANVVYIHASEGVGVGVISQGKLLRGENGYAAEVAHMPIGRSNRRCRTCGCYGCIESDLSIDGFLFSYFGEDARERSVKWNAFSEALASFDPKALSVAQESGHLLGRLVSILINLLDPESVYLGGDISKVYPYLEKAMLEEVDRRCAFFGSRAVKILCDDKSEHRINVGMSEKICSTWSPL